MNAGDIVKFQKAWIIATGIVIETGVFPGNKDIKVMWEDGVIFTKDNISSDNVLLYLNSWIDGSYTYEEEMILDPSSTQQFSLNELHYEGEPGW